MLSTENIGLKKPGYNDEADIAVINENSDIIDREFGNRYLKSETYSVEQANNAIAQAIEALPNGLVYRGAVNYYKDLPTANNELGDTYSVKYQDETGTTADGNEYAWGEYDGTLQWIKLGVNAYTKNEIDEQHRIIKSDILNAKNDIAINRTTLGTQCKNFAIVRTSVSGEYHGAMWTKNADESITINGTPTQNNFPNIADFTPKKIGRYYLSGCPKGGGQGLYQMYIEGLGYDAGSGAALNVTELKTYRVKIAAYANYTYDNLTFYPMIRPADITDDTYEPYKPTLQDQINALVERIQALETAQTTTTSE